MSALDFSEGSGFVRSEADGRFGVSVRTGGAGASETIRGDETEGWSGEDDANDCIKSSVACLRDNIG